MNELEKAAKEYADGFERLNPNQDVNVQSARIVGFKRGAEWQAKQSPWKIVADEEPPVYEDVLLSAGSRPDIFVGYFNGKDFVCRWTGEKIEYFRVLHWMPIPE